MSIFVDRNTRVIVQGITGKEGAFWTAHMLDMGTSVVAGVTPGKEGEKVRDVPVYHSIRRAQDALRAGDDAGESNGSSGGEADAAMLFVPPRFTRDAVFEALDGGIRKIVTIADGIPLHDQIEIRAAAISAGAQVVGGNTSGVISPGQSMLGIFPYWIKRVYNPGTIGVMTRSGSLTNEVTAMIVEKGFGVSTLIGVGGDPVPGTRFAEFLPAFENDPNTEGVVIVGELGGTMEEDVARAIKDGTFTKPLVAFIGGRTAPKGKRMGHAGAIVTGTAGTVAAKSQALTDAGALVADRPSKVGEMLLSLMPDTRQAALGTAAADSGEAADSGGAADARETTDGGTR